MSKRIYLKSKLDPIISCLKHFKSSAATGPWSWCTGSWSAPTYYIIFITTLLCPVFHTWVIPQFFISRTCMDLHTQTIPFAWNSPPFPLNFLLYSAYSSWPNLVPSPLGSLPGLPSPPPPHQTSFQCGGVGGGGGGFTRQPYIEDTLTSSYFCLGLFLASLMKILIAKNWSVLKITVLTPACRTLPWRRERGKGGEHREGAKFTRAVHFFRCTALPVRVGAGLKKIRTLPTGY